MSYFTFGEGGGTGTMKFVVNERRGLSWCNREIAFSAIEVGEQVRVMALGGSLNVILVRRARTASRAQNSTRTQRSTSRRIAHSSGTNGL
jgi:hypothetical protein